jgi:hypothetical protein
MSQDSFTRLLLISGAQHSPAAHVAAATVSDVHPTGGTRRVFKQFTWLGVGSVKMALSRPAWLSTGEAVSRHISGYPAESMRGLRKPLGGLRIKAIS